MSTKQSGSKQEKRIAAAQAVAIGECNVWGGLRAMRLGSSPKGGLSFLNDSDGGGAAGRAARGTGAEEDESEMGSAVGLKECNEA
jgi:Ni,Fe-hydrogenase I small subunit